MLEARAFYSIEPWGCIADDHRAALIAFTDARMNYYKGRKPRFEDYLMQWGGGETKQRKTGDELLRSFKAISNRLGDRRG